MRFFFVARVYAHLHVGLWQVRDEDGRICRKGSTRQRYTLYWHAHISILYFILFARAYLTLTHYFYIERKPSVHTQDTLIYVSILCRVLVDLLRKHAHTIFVRNCARLDSLDSLTLSPSISEVCTLNIHACSRIQYVSPYTHGGVLVSHAHCIQAWKRFG